jgi:DNA-binding CsgD family transcriptional regulator
MAKRAAALSEIRQLCCLGLPAQQVMPLLLATLHRVIPSYTNLFDWVDHDCQIRNYYSEDPICPDAARLYFEEFYNKREREVLPAFSEQVRTARGVINSDGISNAAFYRSDFYNEIWRPRQVHHKLEAIIRQHDLAVGSLVLYRRPDEPQFGRREEEILARLIPYIAHAVTHSGQYEGQYVSSGETGLVVVNDRGTVLFQCPEGQRLLYLATHPVVDPKTIASDPEGPVMAHWLSTISRALVDVAQGRSGSPPVLEHRNAWGRFVLRAHWLKGHVDTSQGCIGIAIERHVPFPLRIAHALQDLPLSSRQRELCALLTQGGTYSAIAKLMHLSEHTVISYARAVYDKLDLNGRDKLVRKLLAPAGTVSHT